MTEKQALDTGEKRKNDLPDRYLDFTEVTEMVNLSRSTIKRLERNGEFPSRRKISSQKVSFLKSEVIEWMENRPKVYEGTEEGKGDENNS